MQSHESKNEKCEINAEEKIIVITLILLQQIEPVVHFSLGPNSHRFCVQKRTCVKIFLIVRTLSVSLPVTDLGVLNILVGMKNSWTLCEILRM